MVAVFGLIKSTLTRCNDETFYHIVWDPPHRIGLSERSITAIKYGSLLPDVWEHELKTGFKELWRVLKPNGTLVFKWSEGSKKVSDVLKLFPETPLYGHTTGKAGATKWMVFFKS